MQVACWGWKGSWWEVYCIVLPRAPSCAFVHPLLGGTRGGENPSRSQAMGYGHGVVLAHGPRRNTKILSFLFLLILVENGS